MMKKILNTNSIVRNKILNSKFYKYFTLPLLYITQRFNYYH